jgi:hypothetical protein
MDGGAPHRGNRHQAAGDSKPANDLMGGVANAGHGDRVEGDANPNQRPHAGSLATAAYLVCLPLNESGKCSYLFSAAKK